ncbi:hypothetical protein [Rhodovulum euryhalinum]|jgi:hypothetical protein|uniref:Uncharacterized protein n=1 Tax=Rhodovulum euryhalinum TaxID=35805 RepID=A0A4R2KY85_9RHOB|nr:hypothetical protein [Rhodovulum euryhalinum]TCO71645.1 hypothetical protein EV655_106137 [Rhodovulum euryhalinum]
MLLLLGLYLCFSLALLLGAAEIERRAIVARRLGPNGKAFLAAIVTSMVVSLGVTVASAFIGGWIQLLHVLGGSILYHGVMGIFLVHGLQEVSARVAVQGTA